MKKIGFLFVSALVLGMAFTSCSKDDDSSSSDSTTPASVEGKWTTTRLTSVLLEE